MEKWSKIRVMIIKILLDDGGVSGRVLAEKLDKKQSNLNNLIKELIEEHIIYRGPQRISTKPTEEYIHIRGSREKHPEYRETPYFIERNIETLNKILYIIEKEADSKFKADERRIYILRSKYVQNLKAEYPEEIEALLKQKVGLSIINTNEWTNIWE